MSYSPYQDQPKHANPYAYDQVVAHAQVDERVAFIRRTYAHLTGAIMAFILIESLIFTLLGEQQLQGIMNTMLGSQYSWLFVLGAFMAASWVAEKWARSDASVTKQYMGLSLIVVAYSILFIPILYIADRYYPGAISSAAITTAVVFGGLTATVFITKADFSFLRMGLTLGSFAALGLIGASFFVSQIDLGFWFSALMVVLMSGYILYHTSNIMRHYRTTQHVAAALALFSSVAMLFWYILQMFMSRD